jgi:hypothetical protein
MKLFKNTVIEGPTRAWGCSCQGQELHDMILSHLLFDNPLKGIVSRDVGQGKALEW